MLSFHYYNTSFIALTRWCHPGFAETMRAAMRNAIENEDVVGQTQYRGGVETEISPLKLQCWDQIEIFNIDCQEEAKKHQV